jgi:hypothetical protein
MDVIEQPPAPGRSCGDCALCCKVMGIQELEKPPGSWCPHCVGGKLCGRYETRPGECRTFNCGYLTQAHIDEAWKPNKSKIVLVAGPNSIMAYVDPGSPAAWRKEPYYSNLRQWSANALPTLGQVCVRIGRRVIAILPNSETDLGIIEDDERVLIERRHTPGGPVVRAIKVKQDDPRFIQSQRNG